MHTVLQQLYRRWKPPELVIPKIAQRHEQLLAQGRACTHHTFSPEEQQRERKRLGKDLRSMQRNMQSRGLFIDDQEVRFIWMTSRDTHVFLQALHDTYAHHPHYSILDAWAKNQHPHDVRHEMPHTWALHVLCHDSSWTTTKPSLRALQARWIMDSKNTAAYIFDNFAVLMQQDHLQEWIRKRLDVYDEYVKWKYGYVRFLLRQYEDIPYDFMDNENAIMVDRHEMRNIRKYEKDLPTNISEHEVREYYARRRCNAFFDGFGNYASPQVLAQALYGLGVKPHDIQKHITTDEITNLHFVSPDDLCKLTSDYIDPLKIAALAHCTLPNRKSIYAQVQQTRYFREQTIQTWTQHQCFWTHCPQAFQDMMHHARFAHNATIAWWKLAQIQDPNMRLRQAMMHPFFTLGGMTPVVMKYMHDSPSDFFHATVHQIQAQGLLQDWDANHVCKSVHIALALDCSIEYPIQTSPDLPDQLEMHW